MSISSMCRQGSQALFMQTQLQYVTPNALSYDAETSFSPVVGSCSRVQKTVSLSTLSWQVWPNLPPCQFGELRILHSVLFPRLTWISCTALDCLQKFCLTLLMFSSR